jgi:hypothetical protein
MLRTIGIDFKISGLGIDEAPLIHLPEGPEENLEHC